MQLRTKLSFVAVTLALSLLGGNPLMALADPTAPAISPAAARGDKIFQNVCSLCHGHTANGREELGLPLRTSQFVNKSTNDQLVQFLKVGREGRLRLARRSDGTLGEPTCGFNMPARGGDNALTDRDLADVVAYLRSINH